MARDQTSDLTLASVAYPGCPLAPRGLHVVRQGPDWLEVAWRPSQVVIADGTTKLDGIVGYRVFVDGMEREMVYDSKTSVVLKRPDHTEPVR